MQSALKMISSVAIVALFVAPAVARAQTSADDSSVATLVDAPETRTLSLTIDERANERRPAAPAARNDHDALFQGVSAALIATASTDLSVSMYQIGRGAAREVGFGAAWQDSPVAFAVTKSAMAGVFVYGLQRLHKTRPKTAIALGLAATAVEGWLTARSARIAP